MTATTPTPTPTPTATPIAAKAPIRSPFARELQGKRAGFVTRAAADGIDWAIVVGIYVGILIGLGVVEYLFGSGKFDVPRPPASVTLTAEWVIAVLYLTAGWAGTGRTVGKSFMGLRAINNNGTAMRPRRAFFRALICCTLGPAVLLWVIVSRHRFGVHDVILRTIVVYDWSARS